MSIIIMHINCTIDCNAGIGQIEDKSLTFFFDCDSFLTDLMIFKIELFA